MGESFKTEAERNEALLQSGLENERDIQLTKDMITSSRNIAANCLRMAANCLTMPDAGQETTNSEI
jgi:hypothetical protein